VLSSRSLKLTLAAAFCALLVAGSAFAAVDYVYQNGYAIPFAVASDFTVHYRNYNDSCSGDGYATTKSIYGLSDGSWVATISSYNACGFSKAHLGPSSNYGYTYVQSKCKNMEGGYVWLYCNTTRPS
jgi:hypothetical protein